MHICIHDKLEDSVQFFRVIFFVVVCVYTYISAKYTLFSLNTGQEHALSCIAHLYALYTDRVYRKL